MKKVTSIIIYLILAILMCFVFMGTGMANNLAIMNGLSFFALFYLIGEFIKLYVKYRKAESRAFNRSQGIPAIIGAVMVVTVNIFTTMSFYILPEITWNLILNLVLIVMVAFLSVYSLKNAFLYLKDGILYCGKELPLDQIIRYTATKNRKGRYTQMTIDYNSEKGVLEGYMSYSKELEAILDQNLSKKKRGY